MSWRSQLMLSAVVLSILFTTLAPTFTLTELASYDYRLRRARYLRGNIVPSAQILMLGRTTETLVAHPDWRKRDTAASYRAVKEAGAKAVWVDTDLKLNRLPEPEVIPPLRPAVSNDNIVRRSTLADPETGALSPALTLYTQLQGIPPEEITVTKKWVDIGNRRLPRHLPIDFPPHTSHQQDSASISRVYLEPLSIHLLFDDDRGALSNAEAVLKQIPGAAVMIVEHTQEARRRFATPVGDLEAHQIEFATLDTLLSGWTLRSVPLVGTIALAFLASFGFAWLTFYRSVFYTILAWGVTSLIYWWIAVRLFASGWAIPVVPVLASGLLSAIIVAGVQQFRAYRMMSRLLGDERAAAAARGEAELGGEERIVTILFTNLPEEIQALEETDPCASIIARNRYCRYLTAGVKKYGGWVLDYQGDFQMAGFGVETIDPDHAYQATLAALELCRSLGLRYPKERIHCGVCTGPAAVGLVGAPSAKALAAIGDTTNVAARLLGAAKKQNVPVLISESTYELCGDRLHTEKLDPVDLKGKTTKVEVRRVEGPV